MLLHLDIETLPTTDPEVIAELAKDVLPPGNISKVETIAAWEAEKKPALVAEAVSRTSFNAMYGRICVIGYAFGDDEPETLEALTADDERVMIEAFFGDALTQLRASFGDTITVVGHNITGFDLPFLRQRCMILGIRPPQQILNAMTAKPWEKNVADTMLMWSAEREKRVSLDRLCRAFGVPGKDGFDGSMVAEAWKRGEHTKVMDYCADDVERARSCYRRMTWTDK